MDQRDEECLRKARALVDAQANDISLWFIAERASEEYLQQALRELHAVIEGVSATQQAWKIILR